MWKLFPSLSPLSASEVTKTWRHWAMRHSPRRLGRVVRRETGERTRVVTQRRHRIAHCRYHHPRPDTRRIMQREDFCIVAQESILCIKTSMSCISVWGNHDSTVCSQELTLCSSGARRVTVLSLTVTETCDQEKSKWFWKKRMKRRRLVEEQADIIGWWWPGWVRYAWCDQWPGPGMRTMTEMSRAASVDQAARTAQPCWPMSGVARVTKLVTWLVTGAAWAAWHPALAGWASTQSGDTESGAGTRAMTLSMRHSGHRETSDSVISVTSWQSDVTQHYRHRQAH